MGFDVAAFGIWYFVFLFSTVAHEAAHGWVAYLGGDPKAYHGGLVTLDPIAHIKRSPVGMLIVPLITFYQLGWTMGWASVPFDPRWAKRHPKRQGMMSLAGPAANLVLASFGIAAIWVLVSLDVLQLSQRFAFDDLVRATGPQQTGSIMSGFAMGLSVLVNLNVLLGLFNLVPVPPLDGAGVLEGFFPGVFGSVYEYLRQIPILQLVGLLVAWNVFPILYRPALIFVYGLILSSPL